MTRRPSRISPAWRRQAVWYRHFASSYAGLDYSDGAVQAMYDYESRGVPIADPWRNGYYVGKHWMDWQINAWREGLAEGTLRPRELDGYPVGMLKRVGITRGTSCWTTDREDVPCNA